MEFAETFGKYAARVEAEGCDMLEKSVP